MLETLHQLEIAWVLFIQSIGQWLAPLMVLFTQVGSENFFMFVMPTIYWSFDSIIGIEVATLLLLSNGFNAGFKLIFHSSRPYWLSPRIHAFSAESTYGFPSNHSQTAASIWGFLAIRLRGTTGKILLLLLVFLIGFSRIYLAYITSVMSWADGCWGACSFGASCGWSIA